VGWDDVCRDFQSPRRLDRFRRVGVEHDGRQEALRQIGERKAIGAIAPRTGGHDHPLDQRRREAELAKRSLEQGAALLVVGPLKQENVGGTPLDRGIERPRRLVHIRRQRRLAMRSTPRMNAFTPARSSWCICALLRERICLIDEEDDAPTCLRQMAFELAGLGDGVLEGGRQQLRHFPDAALAARREAQRKQRDVDALLPGNGVPDGLRELGLARADIARAAGGARWS
jgi:hypothetical protein